MTKHNECVEAVLGELDRYGLKGEVIDRSKHLEIAWDLASGQRRSVVVAATPSDHRAWLNERAHVRRLLKQDGVQPPAAKVVSIKRAFELPKPHDTAAHRLARLELDFDALLDLTVELQTELNATREQLKNIRVTVSFGAETQKPVEKPAKLLPRIAQAPRGSVKGTLLGLLQGNGWVLRGELVQRSGLRDKNLSACLSHLKAEGLVENGQRGMWRLKPQSQLASG